MAKAAFDKYSLTERAKQGFDALGEWMHVSGYANIVSFTIWHLLDVQPISGSKLEEKRKTCAKRIGYVYTPKRFTVALTLSEDTKKLFEQIYVAAGIDSFSAALDLIGQAIPIPDDKEIEYTNGFINPFYWDESRGHCLIMAHGCKSLCSPKDYILNDNGIPVCPVPDAYQLRLRKKEPVPENTFSVETTLSPEIKPEGRHGAIWTFTVGENADGSTSIKDSYKTEYIEQIGYMGQDKAETSASSIYPHVTHIVPGDINVEEIERFAKEQAAKTIENLREAAVASSSKAPKSSLYDKDGVPRSKRAKNPFTNKPTVKSD